MTDSEQLVQRFLDQELSADERVRFVVRLGRDEALRRRVIELEQLLLGVSRLPRPAVPGGFVASVMERTTSREPAPSAWRRLADTLWAPRAFQWNLASVGSLCVASIAVGAVVAGGLLRQPVSTPGAAPAPIAATGPAAPSPVLIRLVIVQPGAKMVQVAGDFNGWAPERTPLAQISSGAWAVTLPLKPGRYEYMFVVDGHQWIADPFAAEQNDDGFGSRNAALDVRPPVRAQS